jgi:hypothetical protein
MMLENAWMALHGYATLGKNIEPDIEWIKSTVRFYDSYYRNETKRLTGSELDSVGKLCIYPANSIELLIGAKNPIEVVAGLRRLCDALTKLPVKLVSLDEKAYFANLLNILPELPKGEKDGKIYLLPTWPVKWDVDFKLHAPQHTIIELSVKNGKVLSLKVTPESRRKVIVMNPFFKL